MLAKSLQTAQLWTDQAKQRGIDQADPKERHFKSAIGKLRHFGKDLSLDMGIVRRGEDLLQALSQKEDLGARHTPAYFLAILYLACKEENAGRTCRELAAAAGDPLRKAQTEKAILKNVTELTDKLRGELQVTETSVDVEQFMPRLIAKLKVPYESLCTSSNRLCILHSAIGSQGGCLHHPAVYLVKLSFAMKYVQMQRPGDEQAIAAASILIVAWLQDVKPRITIADVAVAADVTEQLVNRYYGQLRDKAAYYVGTFQKDFPGFKVSLPGGTSGLPAKFNLESAHSKKRLRMI